MIRFVVQALTDFFKLSQLATVDSRVPRLDGTGTSMDDEKVQVTRMSTYIMQIKLNNHPEKDKRHQNYNLAYFNNIYDVFVLFTGSRKLITLGPC